MSPDMSYLCKDWTPTPEQPEIVTLLPADKALSLTVDLAGTIPFEGGPLSLLRARPWELLLRGDGVLCLQRKQGSPFYRHVTAPLSFSLSFNPVDGGISIVLRENTLVANVGGLRGGHYKLRIGTSLSDVADVLPPFGWKMTVRHELKSGKATSPVLAPVRPHESLKLALDQIEHWLSVARSAMKEGS